MKSEPIPRSHTLYPLPPEIIFPRRNGRNARRRACNVKSGLDPPISGVEGIRFMSVETSFHPFPRSAFDRVNDLVYFARMLDKIRLRAAGCLRPDFHGNLGTGFDGRCCRFLGVTYPDLCERTMVGGSDEEIFAWCGEHGARISEEQILVWNKFMLKRGWRDEDDGSTQELEAYKAASGLSHRTDLVTYFDYYEVDEGRQP